MRQTVFAACLLALVLPACVPVMSAPDTPATPEQAAARKAALTFLEVVAAVEPVAERVCRAKGIARNCDFRIVVDDRPGQPPNAFQTLDRNGLPLVGFTLSLIADARNADELAFILGHEAAHHSAGHLAQQREEALSGALQAGIVAEAGGLSPAEIDAVQNIAAALAVRSYSKQFELEADALGVEIALIAGYDPIIGAGFFDRLPDPGDRFLGSHPPNAQRKALVVATVRRLGG